MCTQIFNKTLENYTTCQVVNHSIMEGREMGEFNGAVINPIWGPIHGLNSHPCHAALMHKYSTHVHIGWKHRLVSIGKNADIYEYENLTFKSLCSDCKPPPPFFSSNLFFFLVIIFSIFKPFYFARPNHSMCSENRWRLVGRHSRLHTTNLILFIESNTFSDLPHATFSNSMVII